MAVLGSYTRTMWDYGSEKTIFRCRCTALTAANFDAQETLRAALSVAIAGITIGTLEKWQHCNSEFQTSTPPSDPFAQRESKWLIDYRDAVTEETYRMELGTADLDQLDPNDRAHAHIGDAGVVDAFVTALEAFALSKDGNAIEVVEMTFVGRNT